jgi:hypothetical protein
MQGQRVSDRLSLFFNDVEVSGTLLHDDRPRGRFAAQPCIWRTLRVLRGKITAIIFDWSYRIRDKRDCPE